MVRHSVYSLAYLNGYPPWNTAKPRSTSTMWTPNIGIDSFLPVRYSRLDLIGLQLNSSDDTPIPMEVNSTERHYTETYASYIRNFRCKSIASPDSVFREPLPGEEITLPNPSRATGEYLLDRGLIAKIAELRTFIEEIEISRGKHSTLKLMEREMNKDNAEILCLSEEEANKMEGLVDARDVKMEEEPLPPIEINDKTLEPINEHLFEENMLEEVLGKAISVYRKDRDQVAITRLQDIAEEMAPFVEKFRKSRAENIIVRLIDSYLYEKEDFNTLLEELYDKKQLNKYLIQRFDELIKLTSQKFRISDKHPAISENFLRILKDRVAAQMLTSARGTAKWVRILAECFKYTTCVEYEEVLRKNLRKIEDIEDFRNWLLDGIAYCRDEGKLEDRIEAMESIESIAVSLHPVWTPVDDHIETEDTPYDHPLMIDESLAEL
ncbi:hypothetical protein BBOV_III008290 [Babesia bovis T2Bo]|uniref:Uncharacterized protein n=1 Tax=Babesia bovis TaxID=5865 RepID=A7APA5_BABBO|nr:hypothetical protein BBOV_III008290 [Babesia bovis T2Bo]EDO08389.1 hypothetical protein BBOV_III008290 [Babesia bovis T2Bo]|eukprot:XP_001611957.1 hypothetical protein [Babesia bovis T2Bo]